MNQSPKSRFRFSIRTLLIATASVSVFLAIIVLQILVPWQHECRRIEKISESIPDAQVYTEPQGQFAFRHFFGDRYSERAVHVHLSDPIISDDWIVEHLLHLRHIETLSIKSPNISDAGLKQLASLPNLMSLNLVNADVTKDAVIEFRSDRPRVVVYCSVKNSDGTLHSLDW